jgi:hypothetical protein
MVPVVAVASCGPLSAAAPRVRLNASTASTSQAALAVNVPLGRCARAEFFRSAWTCPMMHPRLQTWVPRQRSAGRTPPRPRSRCARNGQITRQAMRSGFWRRYGGVMGVPQPRAQSAAPYARELTRAV